MNIVPCNFIFSYLFLLAFGGERVTIPFSSGSSRPRDPTKVSCFADGFFIIWVTFTLSQINLSYLGCDLGMIN